LAASFDQETAQDRKHKEYIREHNAVKDDGQKQLAELAASLDQQNGRTQSSKVQINGRIPGCLN
jgi:hypothetical protein